MRDPAYAVVTYWSEEDEAFIAEVPELPGCLTHGDSYEDALAQAHDAIGSWIDTAEHLGRPVPRPRGRLSLAA